MLAHMEHDHEGPAGSGGGHFADASARASEPAADRLHRLRRGRLEGLRKASNLEWLTRLVVGGAARRGGHPDNAMHVALTDGSLTEGEFAQFLAAYYWGSRHLLNETVPSATPGGQDNAWYREYIKALVIQEDGPEGRRGILKRYLQSLEFDAGEVPESAEAFVERTVEGYRADLGRAIGYALAVEVESDFQLSLIAHALMQRFPRATAETVYSDLLLDTGREVERARSLCSAIEGLLGAHEISQADVEAGFVRAVEDAREFMLGLYQELKGDQPATQVW